MCGGFALDMLLFYAGFLGLVLAGTWLIIYMAKKMGDG